MGTERCDITHVETDQFKQMLDKMNVDYTILNSDKALISKCQYDSFLTKLVK